MSHVRFIHFFVLLQGSTAQTEVGKGATIWQANHASLEVDMSVEKVEILQVSNEKTCFLG